MDNRARIARKIAQDIEDGEFVNFGHGIPYSVPQYIDAGKTVFMENEPGVVCFGAGVPADPGDYECRDAMNNCVKELPGGGCFFDTAASFAMIRGGHIDKTVLGALQVDENANIANWAVPGRPVTGIGGAMDLCAGARQVIAAMESLTKDGKPRLKKSCDYPLTGVGVVTRVYTEMAVFDVQPGKGFTLIEKFPDYTLEEIRRRVEAEFTVSPDLKEIDLGAPLAKGT